MRKYIVPFNGTASGIVALATIKKTSGNGIFVPKRFVISESDVTPQTAQNLSLSLNTLGTITYGTGGTSLAVQPVNPGDTAFSGTARQFDTSLPTFSGSEEYIWYEAMYLWLPKERRLPETEVGLNDGLVLYLNSVPLTSVTLLGTIEIWQYGN